MDQSGLPQNRASRRAPVLLTASVDVCGCSTIVKLRNLSSEGALIEGDCLPPAGSTTRFSRKELNLKSTVVWVEGRYAGLAFERSIEAEALLRSIPKPRERVEPVVKRPGLACRPLTSYERRMLDQWMTAAPFGEYGD